jgi:hypothetical protein
MEDLKNFKEFVDSKTETSNYEPPKRVIEPAKDDKIYDFIEKINKKYKNNIKL